MELLYNRISIRNLLIWLQSTGLSIVTFLNKEGIQYSISLVDKNFQLIAKECGYRLRRIGVLDRYTNTLSLGSDTLVFDADLSEFPSARQRKKERFEKFGITANKSTEFHELFPHGKRKRNSRARHIAWLLEHTPEIFFPVAEQDYPTECSLNRFVTGDYTVLCIKGIDTNHPYFETFDWIYVCIDLTESNPLKSIIKIVELNNE